MYWARMWGRRVICLLCRPPPRPTHTPHYTTHCACFDRCSRFTDAVRSCRRRRRCRLFLHTRDLSSTSTRGDWTQLPLPSPGVVNASRRTAAAPTTRCPGRWRRSQQVFRAAWVIDATATVDVVTAASTPRRRPPSPDELETYFVVAEADWFVCFPSTRSRCHSRRRPQCPRVAAAAAARCAMGAVWRRAAGGCVTGAARRRVCRYALRPTWSSSTSSSWWVNCWTRRW